jgi:outer membrane protein assembly factor BamB
MHRDSGARFRRLLPISLAVLAAVAGCQKKAPTRPQKPTGRTRLGVRSSASYSSVTTDPNQDEVLYVFDWGDGTTDTTDFLASGDTARATHDWSEVGDYSVRVRAQDTKGYWSDWSATLAVSVTINHPPNPPAKPYHAGIDSVGKAIAFTTSATDEDGDSVMIKYYFSEGHVSAYGPKTAAGEAYTDTVVYSQNGWKIIFAVASDGTDTSDWSLPDSVYIESPNVAPYSPTIRTEYTPGRGIPNGPQYRFYASARDQYGDSLYYRWYFDETDSVTSPPFPSGVDGYVEWTPALDTHRYTVKVRVFDVSGLSNPTTPIVEFRTVAEGEMIWNIPGEFVASPAIGPILWRGDTRTGIICGNADGSLIVADAYQGFVTDQVSVVDPDAYHSSPTIGADGTKYVGNENGWLYAIRPDDSIKWQFGDGTNGMTATAALGSDGSIYCGGEDQRISRLTDRGTNRTVDWSYDLRQWLTSSPAVGPDGTIYCCDELGYVYALSADGTLQWDFRAAETLGISSSPAVTSDGTVYVGTQGGRLLAIRDGGISWAYTPTPRSGISSPVVGPDGNIYCGSDSGMLYRIDQNTHQPVSNWPVEVSTTSVVSSTPLLCADGIVYVADDSALYAYDASRPDAGPRWRLALTGAGAARRTHRPRPSIDIQPSAAVDDYGIIYIASDYGMFAVAGRPGGTLAAADWPMFHHDPRHTGRFGAR